MLQSDLILSEPFNEDIPSPNIVVMNKGEDVIQAEQKRALTKTSVDSGLMIADPMRPTFEYDGYPSQKPVRVAALSRRHNSLKPIVSEKELAESPATKSPQDGAVSTLSPEIRIESQFGNGLKSAGTPNELISAEN